MTGVDRGTSRLNPKHASCVGESSKSMMLMYGCFSGTAVGGVLMFGRLGSVVGANAAGIFLAGACTATFYGFAALLFCKHHNHRNNRLRPNGARSCSSVVSSIFARLRSLVWWEITAVQWRTDRQFRISVRCYVVTGRGELPTYFFQVMMKSPVKCQGLRIFFGLYFIGLIC